MDSSSDDEDNGESLIDYARRKRPKVEVVKPFAIGTKVKKHFPTEGWFYGVVTGKGRWNKKNNMWVYVVDFPERDGPQDLVTHSELKDIRYVSGPYQDPTLFSFDEFLRLWESMRPEDIEKSSAIRRANTKVTNDDSEKQHNAQYGRFMPWATSVMFQVLRLKRSDVFLDVGHGIGNSCLQAAYCVGCESRGIEVVRDRFGISQGFQARIEDMAKQLDKDERRVSP